MLRISGNNFNRVLFVNLANLNLSFGFSNQSDQNSKIFEENYYPVISGNTFLSSAKLIVLSYTLYNRLLYESKKFF